MKYVCLVLLTLVSQTVGIFKQYVVREWFQ